MCVCDLQTVWLTKLLPFIAIKKARGYRNYQEAIEVNGCIFRISVALERFLRYLRMRIEKLTAVWVHYVCVVESDPEEQATYWTREFSDKMYALADRVFDMHEVNSRLIENAYFEIVFDPRFEERKKEWHAEIGEVILPRVCPIRLGTQFSIEEPTMEYQYMPLDMVADEIRVMCIMPVEDIADPLVIHASRCQIKCEASFFALSCKLDLHYTAPIET